MEKSRRQKNTAISMLLICSGLWSIAGIFIKLIPWNSFVIAGWRSLLAGCIMAAYLAVKKIPFIMNKRSFVTGIFIHLTMMLFCTSNKLTTAANAIVLQFTNPVFIVIISALFMGKRFSKADITAVAVTLLGISMFFLDELDSGNLFGNFIAICSGITYACYYICLSSCAEAERMSAITIANALTFFVGIPFTVATKPQLSALPVVYIFILGVFQLGIPYLLLAKAVEHCPPLACSLLGALDPLLNPVWVFIFAGEAPGKFALIGGAVVVVTISLWCIYNDKKAAARQNETT